MLIVLINVRRRWHMVKSGKRSSGQSNAPYSILEEHLPRLPVKMKMDEATELTEPAQSASRGSYQDFVKAIGITHKPVQITRNKVKKIELQSRMSKPGSSSLFATVSSITAHAAGGLHDSDTPSSRKRMELPRGRFRVLRKNICLNIFIHALHITAFTGFCRINLSGNATLLVFERGRIILAEYDGLAGDVALDQVCSHIYNQVDLLLNDLDDCQISLALEFNLSWKVSMEHDLAFFSYLEDHLLPVAESGVVAVNRTTDIPALKNETGENREFSVLVEQVQEMNRVVSINESAFHRVQEFSEEMPLEFESPDEPGWKKALRLPIGPMTPTPDESPLDEHKVSSAVSLPTRSRPGDQGRMCDLLSAGSMLLENNPIKKKFFHVKYPEPADQWKSMSVNMDQNTSV
jgi:hypothetical protein